MKKITLISIVFAVLASTGVAYAACDQSTNPHSFECHHDAFINRSQFPLVDLDFQNVIQDEWFATTYAVPAGNSGDGFVMDKNPNRPSLPGRGVFNDHGNGRFSLLGSMWINGDQVHFDNWHGEPLHSEQGSFERLDPKTFQFDAVDSLRIVHRFQCRDFVRHDSHHLTCAWMILDNNSWRFIGYFGFVTRRVWDEFVRSGPR